MGRSLSLNKLFAEASGNELAEVIAKTAQLKSVEYFVFSNLPQELRAQIELAAVRDQTLTLICTSSLIANRLRFMETELLTKLNREEQLPTFLRIRAIVRRDWIQDQHSRSTSKTGKGQTISAESTLLIEQTSTIVNNPRLASALKRLAHHANQRRGQAAE